MKKTNTIAVLLLIIITSCTTSTEQSNNADSIAEISTATTMITHAKNFAVEYFENGNKMVEVKEPYIGATHSLYYLLIPKQNEVPAVADSITVVRIPIESIVCTSTTHITPMDLLNVSNTLIGFPSTEYISSEKVRQQVASGKTKELGKDSNLNTEMLIELEPEMVMAYSMTGDYSTLEPIERVGIPVIQNAEYLEETPLGRAEWIKFVAVFFDKEQEADSIFNSIAKNYTDVQKAVASAATSPTVYSGVVYGDTWYMPGGNSWASKYFKDAGADFLWKETPDTGSIPLSFESVYEKANQAQFWIGAGNYYTLESLKATDDRYSQFEAYQSNSVYTYNARASENGGNDYFESGFSRPDLVLSDLVKIIHPTLLPDYQLYYYRALD